MISCNKCLSIVWGSGRIFKSLLSPPCGETWYDNSLVKCWMYIQCTFNDDLTSVCVNRWMVEGPQRGCETRSCPSARLRPTPRPTLRSQRHPQTPRLRYVRGWTHVIHSTRGVLTSVFPSSSGLGPRRHPSSQPVTAAGPRPRSPETLQQESSTNGLDQEERTVQ